MVDDIFDTASAGARLAKDFFDSRIINSRPIVARHVTLEKGDSREQISDGFIRRNQLSCPRAQRLEQRISRLRRINRGVAVLAKQQVAIERLRDANDSAFRFVEDLRLLAADGLREALVDPVEVNSAGEADERFTGDASFIAPGIER